MRADLDHLPTKQQRELERVRTTLLTEFEAAIKSGGGGTQSWRRDGRVLKIILFGSYARNDWVDEPDNGYQSDFDLLVLVSHEKLTDIADYWYVAEDKILRDPAVGRTVNIIVHTMAEVNQALTRGEYFWTDILRDGVVLYELPGHPFAQPKPMTAAEAAVVAQRSFEQWSVKISEALAGVEFYLGRDNRRDAAFLLHQATERAYACFLMTHTFYFPRSHNIKFLRSLAEDTDKRLTGAWPRVQRADRRRFELLKRAYVEARYSDQYDPSAEDLKFLLVGAERLKELVLEAAKERIEKLADVAERDALA